MPAKPTSRAPKIPKPTARPESSVAIWPGPPSEYPPLEPLELFALVFDVFVDGVTAFLVGGVTVFLVGGDTIVDTIDLVTTVCCCAFLKPSRYPWVNDVFEVTAWAFTPRNPAMLGALSEIAAAIAVELFFAPGVDPVARPAANPAPYAASPRVAPLFIASFIRPSPAIASALPDTAANCVERSSPDMLGPSARNCEGLIFCRESSPHARKFVGSPIEPRSLSPTQSEFGRP